MNNKEKAIELLKRYKLIKIRLRILRNKLTTLESLITSVRGVTSNPVPNFGGSSKYEDKLIDYITRKDYYKIKTDKYQEELASIEAALNELTRQEQKVLDIFFLTENEEINGSRVSVLCEALGFEKSHIYRIREQALLRLASVYYARYA